MYFALCAHLTRLTAAIFVNDVLHALRPLIYLSRIVRLPCTPCPTSTSSARSAKANTTQIATGIFALPCNLTAGTIFSLTMPYRINPGRITRPAGAQANSLPATLIQVGVLGVGAFVFWLSWSLKHRWLPVPIFLALALGAFFVWMRVLQYSDDNANQHRYSLIATLM